MLTLFFKDLNLDKGVNGTFGKVKTLNSESVTCTFEQYYYSLESMLQVANPREHNTKG